MRATGLILIAILLAIPAAGFLPIAGARDPVAVFSQYLGASALVVMAVTQVIATRLPGVEAVFGPMDQSYRLHKWLGVGAMVAILLHDTIDAEIEALGRQTILQEAAETLGELSLYGLLILVVITIATFIPYHLWKWTHRLMGGFFAAAALHYLFILKPFKNGDPLGLYIAVICGVGVLAYGYTLMPYRLGRSYRYRVAALTDRGGATEVALDPEGTPLRHRAGQFAFFRFDRTGLGEPHPFTISTGKTDGPLRFTFRVLGDGTQRMARKLAVGDTLRVQGPFGRFFPSPRPGPQVWIAAGIGITPFVAWAEALGEGPHDIHLFYAVRDAAAAPYLDELRAMAKARPGMRLHPVVSGDGKRVSAEMIAETVGDELGKASVYYCGPAVLRRTLKTGLARHGVGPSRFHYEEFEIRTGIGMRRLADWLWRRGTGEAAR